MSKTRYERAIKYNSIREQLAGLGYHPLRPIFLDRWMQYRLIVVAVNHLASVLQRDPYRVYQALRCRAERTAIGRPFMPNRQAKPPLDGPGERKEGAEELVKLLDLSCPWCGGSLLAAGPVTREEVMREIKSQRKSPQSSESEAERAR